MDRFNEQTTLEQDIPGRANPKAPRPRATSIPGTFKEKQKGQCCWNGAKSRQEQGDGKWSQSWQDWWYLGYRVAIYPIEGLIVLIIFLILITLFLALTFSRPLDKHLTCRIFSILITTLWGRSCVIPIVQTRNPGPGRLSHFRRLRSSVAKAQCLFSHAILHPLPRQCLLVARLPAFAHSFSNKSIQEALG